MYAFTFGMGSQVIVDWGALKLNFNLKNISVKVVKSKVTRKRRPFFFCFVFKLSKFLIYHMIQI